MTAYPGIREIDISPICSCSITVFGPRYWLFRALDSQNTDSLCDFLPCICDQWLSYCMPEEGPWNIAWIFGQYNSKVLSWNPRKQSFYDLFTSHHSLRPEILAVQGFGVTKYWLMTPPPIPKVSRNRSSPSQCSIAFDHLEGTTDIERKAGEAQITPGFLRTALKRNFTPPG